MRPWNVGYAMHSTCGAIYGQILHCREAAYRVNRRNNTYSSFVCSTVGGVVALSVEYRTCDREVVGSSLGRARGLETLDKFLTPVCLCSPSSTSWYRPKGGDVLRLGVKAGMVCARVAGKTV